MGLLESIGGFLGRSPASSASHGPSSPPPAGVSNSRRRSRRSETLTEDMGGIGLGYSAFGYGIDPDDALYRRVTQATRELPLVLQERALRLSWSLYESNPLAHGIIEAMKDHVVAKGYEVHSADPDVQAVIDRHWEDPVNHWDLKQHDRVRDLSIYGELMLIAYVNEADGHVRLASMDPIHIRNIYTDEENPEVVHTIIVNPRRRVSQNPSDSDRFYRVVHLDEDPESDSYGRLVGAKPGETFTPPGSKKIYSYTGSCFYFTINRVTGAIRGRSDLLSVIDWLDAYDQILFNFVDRTLLTNSFIWDVTINGANENQMKEWATKHGAPPKPGTVRVHNEGEKWEAVNPAFPRQEFEIQQKTLKAQILSSVGLPPHWFGEHDATRASAQEMSGPALTRLKARQILIKYMLELIIRFQLDQAILAGRLEAKALANQNGQGQGASESAPIREAGPRTPVSTGDQRDDKGYQFEVVMPQMSQKSLAVAGATMMNVVQAIVIAMRAGICDLAEAQQMFVTLATEMGADINLQAMIARMEKSGDLKKAQDQALSPGTDEVLQPQAPPQVSRNGNSTDTNNNRGGRVDQAKVNVQGRPHRESLDVPVSDAEYARELLEAAGLLEPEARVV